VETKMILLYGMAAKST